MGVKVDKQNSLSEKEFELQEEIDTKEQEGNNPLSLSIMAQRGIYKANGYSFTVKAVYFHEVEEYLNDKVYIPRRVDDEGNLVSNKDLSVYMARCFYKGIPDLFEEGEKKESLASEPKGFVEKLKDLFKRKSKIDYSQFPIATGMVKWIERKVSYNGKPILFEDLESKYQLTKAEIAKMLMYLSDISFPDF